jgi:predicted amidophosphoribosyltransferase
MTSQRDIAVSQVRDAIVSQGGGFLRNVVREPLVTCATCGTPVDGFAYCYGCKTIRDYGEPIADIVGSVTYAVKGLQSGHVMHGYKATPHQEEHRQIVQLMAADSLLSHVECASRLVGAPVTSWATVPSLTTSRGAVEHPIHMAVAPFLPWLPEAQVLKSPSAKNPRSFRPENFDVQSDLEGDHLLVIDDTWTSGSQAQSVAVAARRDGAEHVTILTVARWLDLNWQPTRDFVKARLAPKGNDFRPGVCPFTGAACP